MSRSLLHVWARCSLAYCGAARRRPAPLPDASCNPGFHHQVHPRPGWTARRSATPCRTDCERGASERAPGGQIGVQRADGGRPDRAPRGRLRQQLRGGARGPQRAQRQRGRQALPQARLPARARADAVLRGQAACDLQAPAAAVCRLLCSVLALLQAYKFVAHSCQITVEEVYIYRVQAVSGGLPCCRPGTLSGACVSSSTAARAPAAVRQASTPARSSSGVCPAGSAWLPTMPTPAARSERLLYASVHVRLAANLHGMHARCQRQRIA